jgi:hypothetical protein
MDMLVFPSFFFVVFLFTSKTWLSCQNQHTTKRDDIIVDFFCFSLSTTSNVALDHEKANIASRLRMIDRQCKDKTQNRIKWGACFLFSFSITPMKGISQENERVRRKTPFFIYL